VTHSKNARLKWWLYERSRPELYGAIADLDCVLVVAQTSRTQMPVRVPVGPVFDQKLVVFPRQGTADLCFRASSFQYLWTLRMGSTRTADLVFTPSTCSETLPQPQNIDSLQAAGASLEAVRNGVMLDRQIGLTKLYSAMHDPAVTDSCIEDLRDAHSEVDRMVARAYRWADLDIECGFHQTPQGLRYTFSPAVQSEILDRILELNHDRHHLESTGAREKSNERSMGSRKSRSPSGDDALF
ncbi:SAM-dependent DNA methyltransferase, partial [Streptomyces coeruleorubidus]